MISKLRDGKRQLGSILYRMIFADNLEFRVRLFNVLALAGTVLGFVMAITSVVVNHSLIGAGMNLIIFFLAVFLVVYVYRSGNYTVGYLATVILIFIGLFTGLYLAQGGYHSGMPFFFLMGIVYTVYMLRGVLMIAVVLTELVYYTILLLLPLYHPELVIWFATEELVVQDIVVSFLTTALVLVFTLAVQVRLYVLQQKRLEDAIQTKNQFLGSISHEVRTPINMILGMDQMILRESDNPTIREYAKRIEQSGGYLLDLINNLLDLSRFEAGKMELTIQTYDPAELLGSTFRDMRLHAESKGLSFRVEQNNIPKALRGDALYIHQIMVNLLSNAVKYTKKGGISVSLDYVDGQLIIDVSDTGIGIREEQLAVIFDAFSRVNTNAPEIEGVGLGLSIVQSLLTLMKGSIHVDSVYGQGSHFHVAIPQEAGPEDEVNYREKTGRTEILSLKDVRILACDDREENLYVLEALLRRTGAKIVSVVSGEQCIRQLEEQDFDLVLLDYMMPGMNGIETMEAIRAKGLDEDLVVIAVTADVQLSTREKLRDAGFTDCILKPVQGESLEQMLIQYLPENMVGKQSVQEEVCSLVNEQEVMRRMAELDLDLAEGLRGQDGKLNQYHQLCRIFRDYSGSSMAEFQEVLGKDHAQAIRLVHSVKSSARAIGATALAGIAERMERRGLDGDLEYFQAAADILILEWKRACEAAAYLCENVRYGTDELTEDPAMDGSDESEAVVLREVLLQELKEALSLYEGTRAEQLIEQLMIVTSDPDDREKLKQILHHVNNIDFQEAEKLLA